jgi:hypothetical protein
VNGWSGVRVPALAALIVAVSFIGGALSGWFEHGPSTSAGPLPAATVAPSTTSSTVAPGTVAGVQAQIVDDLGVDVTSQRLDPDLARRRALAATPAAVAMRHGLIEEAWAPDQVARVEALYDQLVVQTASDPTVPSVTDAVFDATRWQALTVNGTSAEAVVVGHFRLHEPGNLAARPLGGYVTVFDRTWTVTVTLSNGRWRMEGRSAA